MHKGREVGQMEMFGQYGGELISDAATHTPPTGYVFSAIQVMANAVINLLTVDASAPIENSAGFTGLAVSAGTIIYGKFSSIDLTSGTVLGYYGIV